MRIFFQLNAEKFKRINKKIRASFPAYKTSIADLPESEVGRLCMTTEYGDYICIYKHLIRE